MESNGTTVFLVFEKGNNLFKNKLDNLLSCRGSLNSSICQGIAQ